MPTEDPPDSSRIHRSMKSFLLTTFAAIMIPAAAQAENAYRHIVLFKFKQEATAEQIENIEKAFAALPDKIDTIQDLEWGTDVSPEGKSKGFTHCFVVSFKDAEGLNEYLPHPAHDEFVKLLGPVVDDVIVVDFVGKK